MVGKTLVITLRDSHLNAALHEDQFVRTTLYDGSPFDPPLPSAFQSRSITAIKIELDQLSNTGAQLATLRLAGSLLDLYPSADCQIQISGSIGIELQHCIRFVGLDYRAIDNAIVLTRPRCEASQKGLVSVLIAAHNPRYLIEALQSVERQSYRAIEVIVCDDCPTDEVEKLVLAHARAGTLPLRYFRNATKLGVRRNYERCFENATGEFAKFLNDDDRLEPTCIEKMVAALNAYPTAQLVSAHRRRIDERGHPIRDQPATTPIVGRDTYIEGTSLINALLLLGLNFVGEPSSAMFRVASGRVGIEPLIHFLDSMARGVADMVLWCKLALRGDCIFLAERLTEFRIHAEQRTQATGVSTLALTAIPELREHWSRLGFIEHFPPNVLRTIDLATLDFKLPTNARSVTESWGARALPLFAPTDQSESELIANWKAKRHPYFESQTKTV